MGLVVIAIIVLLFLSFLVILIWYVTSNPTSPNNGDPPPSTKASRSVRDNNQSRVPSYAPAVSVPPPVASVPIPNNPVPPPASKQKITPPRDKIIINGQEQDLYPEPVDPLRQMIFANPESGKVKDFTLFFGEPYEKDKRDSFIPHHETATGKHTNDNFVPHHERATGKHTNDNFVPHHERTTGRHNNDNFIPQRERTTGRHNDDNFVPQRERTTGRHTNDNFVPQRERTTGRHTNDNFVPQRERTTGKTAENFNPANEQVDDIISQPPMNLPSSPSFELIVNPEKFLEQQLENKAANGTFFNDSNQQCSMCNQATSQCSCQVSMVIDNQYQQVNSVNNSELRAKRANAQAAATAAMVSDSDSD